MNEKNHMEIRKSNANLIRKILLSGGEWTKDSLTVPSGLSSATCRNVLLDMLNAGEVLEPSLGASKGGRPAREFRYNCDFVHFILIRVRFDNPGKVVEKIVTDAGGKVLFREESPALETLSINVLCREMESVLRNFPKTGAVALSYPGVVLRGKTSCWGDVEELNGIDLAGLIRERFGKPVTVENDINLAAWGYLHTNGITSANLAYIGFPGNSLPGCGLIVDGKLLRGTRGFAGEVLYIQNQTWDEQRRQIATPRGRADMILRFLRSVTALLDPERVIIANGEITRECESLIREKCRSMTRPELLPGLFFQPDCLADNFTGLLEFARNAFYIQTD